ncbi:hypothetical protein BpHYR1_045974 [Brachionus plicatilis]|uniref:Uncharacterized protein n=1 Tax=Brachionus plicatilis TaxID=10195 RepID=A0A3M7T7C3_BRAPC|nr:hypothetical protein BpHYR1_045974 [Brachionus plicatilis]
MIGSRFISSSANLNLEGLFDKERNYFKVASELTAHWKKKPNFQYQMLNQTNSLGHTLRETAEEKDLGVYNK